MAKEPPWGIQRTLIAKKRPKLSVAAIASLGIPLKKPFKKALTP